MAIHKPFANLKIPMAERSAPLSRFLSRVAPLAELGSYGGMITHTDPAALYRCSPPLSKHVLLGVHTRIFRQLLLNKSGNELASYVDQIFAASRVSAIVNFAVVEDALSSAVVQLIDHNDLLTQRSCRPVNTVCRALHQMSKQNVLAFDMLLNVIPDGSFLGNAVLPAATLLLLSMQYLHGDRSTFVAKVVAMYKRKIAPHVPSLAAAAVDNLKECALQVAGKIFRSWGGSMELAEFFIHLVMGEKPFKGVFERTARNSVGSARSIRFMENMKSVRSYKLIYVLLFWAPSGIEKALPAPLLVDLLAVYLLAVARCMTQATTGSTDTTCYSGSCLFCTMCTEQVRIKSTRMLSEAMCTKDVCVHALILKFAAVWPEYAKLLMVHRMQYFGSDNTSAHLSCGCPMSTGETSLMPCKRPLVFLCDEATEVGRHILQQTLPEEPLRPVRSSVESDYNPFFVGGGARPYTFFKLTTSPQFLKGRFQRLLKAGDVDINPILVSLVVNNTGGISYYALNPASKRVTDDGKVETIMPSDECLARFLCASIVKAKTESVLNMFVQLERTGDQRFARSIEKHILPAHLRLSSSTVPAFTLTPQVASRAFQLLKNAVPFLVECMKKKTDVRVFCELILARVVGACPRLFGHPHIYGYRPRSKMFSRLFKEQNLVAFTMLVVNNRLEEMWDTNGGRSTQIIQALPNEMVCCILNFI